MLLLAEDPFPNFHCKTTLGEFDIKDFIKDSWCLFLSHPCDFTPVCTTELAKAGKMFQDFQKRGVKVIALSCCDLDMHNEWVKDLKALGNLKEMEYPIPIIADSNRDISCLLGMIRPEDKSKTEMPITCRKLFLIGPDGKIKFEMLYPANAGRSFE
jgi:peroxiredoxin 6